MRLQRLQRLQTCNLLIVRAALVTAKWPFCNRWLQFWLQLDFAAQKCGYKRLQVIF